MFTVLHPFFAILVIILLGMTTLLGWQRKPAHVGYAIATFLLFLAALAGGFFSQKFILGKSLLKTNHGWVALLALFFMFLTCWTGFLKVRGNENYRQPHRTLALITWLLIFLTVFFGLLYLKSLP